jgi:hypothetical protein
MDNVQRNKIQKSNSYFLLILMEQVNLIVRHCSYIKEVISFNGIILKHQFYLMVYLSKVYWILEIPTRQQKNTRDSIALQIYLCLEFITWTKQSRLWFQSLNAICFVTILRPVPAMGYNPRSSEQETSKTDIFNYSVYTQLSCTSYNINYTTYFRWNQHRQMFLNRVFYHLCNILNVIKIQCLYALN